MFGNSLEIDWITEDGVIVATGTDWPAEIQIYVPWGNDAVLQGAVAHELLECGAGPWTGGQVRRYTNGTSCSEVTALSSGSRNLTGNS